MRNLKVILIVLLASISMPLMAKKTNCIKLAILPSPKHIQVYKGDGIITSEITNIKLENAVRPVLGAELDHLPYESLFKGIPVVFIGLNKS